MTSTELLTAAKAMQAMRVGPKEAAILAAVGVLDGKGQAAGIGDLAGTKNRSTLSAQLVVLQRKHLIEQVPNPTGWPFYQLTSKARSHINPNLTNQ